MDELEASGYLILTLKNQLLDAASNCKVRENLGVLDLKG